jgi:pectinesterase
MDDFINPKGWSNWNGTENYKTVFYAENLSTGAGAKKNERVPWSHQLTKSEADKYTIKNIFSGLKNWDPVKK